MGIFRLLLAIAVVLQHTKPIGGFQPLGATEAVETFFMISGFYMAMILTEKYRGPGSYRLFLGNRLLRIYPAYWVVAVLTVVLWIIYFAAHKGGGPLSVFGKLDHPATLFVSVTNALIFGQDVVMFTGADAGGHLFFTPNFADAAVQTWRFLLVPPAWSLALELAFYVVAPFLVRRSAPVIMAIMALCLALRAYLFFAIRLQDDPWTYRLFFTELMFFLAGALAYRVYLWLQGQRVDRWLLKSVGGVVYAFYFAYQFLPEVRIGGATLKPWAFFLVAWMAIPALFILCKRSGPDRYIGELSYPLYIVHWLVLTCISSEWVHVGLSVSGQLSAIALSLLAAWLLFHFVSEPIEAIRRQRSKQLPTIQA